MRKVVKIIFSFLLVFQYSVTCLGQDDTIVVGCDYNYPPFSFIDEKGKPAGYDIDVMNAIAEITGLKIKFSPDSWDSTLNKLKRGDVDVVTSIVYYSDREKIYDYSFPLHTEFYAIFAKKRTPIGDINDLEQKKPAILEGDISNDLFYKPMGLFKNYVTVQSLPEAFSLVNSDSCDYVIAPYSIGMEVIKEEGLGNLEVKGDPIIPSVFCYAVKEDNYELLAWINQGIQLLSRNGQLDSIYNKWVKYKPGNEQYKKFFYYAVTGLLILTIVSVLLFLYWYSLKKQVKKKTEEIKKSEVIYENVFNAVDNGLIILDETETIITANRKASELLDYHQGELIGKNIAAIPRNPSRQKLLEIYQTIKSGDSFIEENIERVNDEQSYHLVIKGLKINIGDKQRYLIVINDITREHINLLKLREAKKNADLANNAKGAFLSTISHEIRTPLFAVIGYTELMAKTVLSELQHDYNKKIQLSGKLLLNLVNDILDLTKLEAEKLKLNPECFNIHELIDEICEVESVKANEKNLRLHNKIGDDVPDFLIGDKLYLSRIVMNIVNNAIKFTSAGEVSLLVNVENVSQISGNDEVRIIFSIRDTGIGMSTEAQKKLFSPFEQVQNTGERRYGGTGLGLAISKQLVELMHGEILVESTEGRGSVFNVSVPLGVADSPVLKSEQPDAEQKPVENISVLLVEDNEFNAEILLNQLNDAKFEVVHANSGFKALEILHSKSFQVILMDIEMPGMDGFATLGKIREQQLSEAPVIALSAHNLSSEKEKALQVGMVAYLNKPISIKELSAAIYKAQADSKQLSGTEYQTINSEEGLAFFDDDTEAYTRALERFKKHFGGIPGQLMALYHEDPVQLKNHTHNLKSAAKTIGALELHAIAQSLDELLRNNPDSFTINDLQVLKAELEKVLDEIKPGE